MKRILFTLTLVVTLLPNAYAQTGAKRPTTQRPTVAQPAGTTNTAPENTVSGSLTFNGKTAALQYVYAKSGQANYIPGIHLYFTDRPIVEAVAEDQFQLQARDGQVNGLYVRLDAATKRVLGYEIGINKEYLMVYNYDYSRAGEGFSDEIFNLTTSNPALLQGTISANRTMKKLDVAKSTIREERFNQFIYRFNLTFKVQLKKNTWMGNFGVYPPITLELGRAEGELVDQGQKKKSNYVRALMKEADNELALIFTEQPVSQPKPGKEHTPYLQIRINPKTMTVHGVDIMRANGNESFASSAMNNNFTIREGSTIEGRFIFAGTYQVACKAFIEKVASEADPHTLVTARTGKPLPVDGGEPGRAFVQYMAALANTKTFEEVARVIKDGKASVTDEAQSIDKIVRTYTDKQKKELFELMRTISIMNNVRVISGFFNKDKATLKTIGVVNNNKVDCEVNMHFEGGQWKVGREAILPSGKSH